MAITLPRVISVPFTVASTVSTEAGATGAASAAGAGAAWSWAKAGVRSARPANAPAKDPESRWRRMAGMSPLGPVWGADSGVRTGMGSR